MKKYLLLKVIVIATVLNFAANSSKGQILISLIFGDKLNSEKIEFGLEGGLNWSNLSGIDEAEYLRHFNLGFYFFVNLKNSTYLSTGVLVKSSVGASNINPYPIGDDELDSVLESSTIDRKINYFYVPIMIQQRFNNRFYVEGGVQLGLRSKAFDEFNMEIYGNDLVYKYKTSDNYKRIDAGLVAGAGYKFLKQIKSISMGVKYYYGLMNIYTEGDVVSKNSSINLFVRIPIGAGKTTESEN